MTSDGKKAPGPAVGAGPGAFREQLWYFTSGFVHRYAAEPAKFIGRYMKPLLEQEAETVRTQLCMGSRLRTEKIPVKQ